MKYNFAAMLQALHKAGVEIKVVPNTPAWEWHSYIIGLFEFHCMPNPHETRQETAEIMYKNRGFLGRAGQWQKLWAPIPKRNSSAGYKRNSYRTNTGRR